jgi:hypothetical protein
MNQYKHIVMLDIQKKKKNEKKRYLTYILTHRKKHILIVYIYKFKSTIKNIIFECTCMYNIKKKTRINLKLSIFKISKF